MVDLVKERGLIGNNILYKPGSEFSLVLQRKDTWAANLCWFCEKHPADRHVQLERFPFKEKTRSFDGGKWVVEGDQLVIKVPRCAKCHAVHRFRRITPFISLPVLFIVWFGPILLMNLLNVRLTERFILEPLLFMALGLIVYFVTWLVLIPQIFTPDAKETKEEALWFTEFPGMDEVRKAGFKTQV
jgi:hypothetical protein